MSIPPHLDLPACVRAHTLVTTRGEIAVLEATPISPAPGAPPAAPEFGDEPSPSWDEEGNYSLPEGYFGDPPGGTALLVPGYTGSKEDFLPLLDRLAEYGYRVLALDQRGQCDTPGPEDSNAYAISELAADVLALAAACGDESVHLVGHSFGGLVVRAAAIAAPAAVRSVTLLCSGPGSVPPDQAAKISMLVEAAAVLDLADLWTIAAAAAAANGEHDGVSEEVLEFLARRFTSASRTGLAAMGAQLIDTPDRTAELRASGVAVMVAHGADDDVWPVDEQLTMAIELGAIYEVFEGAAHSPAVQSPGVTAKALVSFWSSVD
ncbi:MAG: alpha/beta fold hydrolase [Sporichthyaceae bacterium]